MGCITLLGTAKLVRDKQFKELSEKDIAHFRELVGEKGVIVDQDELKVANADWMNKYHGQSQLLLRPQTTEQVSDEKEFIQHLLEA